MILAAVLISLGACPAGGPDKETTPRPEEPEVLEAPPKTARKMCVCKCVNHFIPVADTTDVMKCREFQNQACINRDGTMAGRTEDCGIALVYPTKPDDDTNDVVDPAPPASPPTEPRTDQPTVPEQPGADPGRP